VSIPGQVSSFWTPPSYANSRDKNLVWATDDALEEAIMLWRCPGLRATVEGKRSRRVPTEADKPPRRKPRSTPRPSTGRKPDAAGALAARGLTKVTPGMGGPHRRVVGLVHGFHEETDFFGRVRR